MKGAHGHDVVLYTDGGSRGNPGPAAAAAVALSARDGSPRGSQSRYLGVATNNVAEYEGLLLALALARRLSLTDVQVRSDSELLVRQFEGRYKVASAHLKPLFARAKAEAAAFRSVTLRHVPRERNRAADRLVNEALDRAASGGTMPVVEGLS